MSVLKLSDILFDNHSFRFDSEYVKKEYLLNIETLKCINNSTLSTHIEHMSGGATPLGAEYQTEGVPFLRVQNIMQNYFNLNDVVYLTQIQDKEIARSKLKYNDVLLTITGVSYGKSAVVNKELANANINQHSVKITLKDSLNPYFLSTFLNCHYGKIQSDKNVVGVTRPALDYTVIRNFIIPNFTCVFQNSIEKTIHKAEGKILSSKSQYSQAESLLLETLGLESFYPSEEAVNIKSFSESFGISGRLDAEYYQVKYEEMLKIIESKANELKPLSYFIDNYSTGYTYKSDTYIQSGGVPLIRINNIVNGNLDINNAIHIPKKDMCLSVKDIVKENDILISMSGTIGSSCKIPKGVKAVVNQRIMRITSKNINVEVLPLIINSIIGKLQLERIETGGVQTNISSSDISNILIPHIDSSIQEQITSLVEESFSLKSESERLLELAKTAVEMAIEEGEEKAMDYVKVNN